MGALCQFCYFDGVVLVLGNRFIFKSIHELSDASARVARGDYTPRLEIPKEREIGELVENFNHMAEQLSKKETLASDFITSISHEFKTPLATIRGYAQLLNEDVSSEKREQYVAIITKKVDVLTDLVTKILELSNWRILKRLYRVNGSRLTSRFEKIYCF
jgi:signal transduction histidine kinase